MIIKIATTGKSELLRLIVCITIDNMIRRGGGFVFDRDK